MADMQRGKSGAAPELPERVLYRQRFLVEIVWSQPVAQTYVDDWSAVIGNAVSAEAPTLWDIGHGPAERLEVVDA